MVPARTQSANTFEAFLTRLRESHDVSVYEAIERLTHASFTELRDAAGIRPTQRKKVHRKTKAASTATAPKIAPTPMPAPVVVPVVVSFPPSESKRVPEAAPTTKRENDEARFVVA